jgi:uncharacterized protein
MSAWTSVDVVRAEGLNNERLHLIIMPTEKCNCRCTYCYEDFIIGRMSDKVADSIKRLIDRRKETLRSLHIGWFGGEPTLCPEVITSINGHAIEVLNDGAVFTSSISTNGVLLDERIFHELVNARVSLYQISLDGTPAQHDTTRVTVRGGGTFDRIIRNITNALLTSFDFKIILRLHLHENNLAGMEHLLSMIVELFKRDSRVTVYFKPVERLGSPNDRSFPFLDPDHDVQRLTQRARDLGILESDTVQPACYAAKANSLVIRPDGRIAKCTVAFRDERNVVGTIAPDGTLAIDQDRFKPWIRGILSGNEAEMKCPLIGLPG